MQKQKILITGASGYVGAYIYKFLKDKGVDVKGTYYKNKLFDDLVQVDLTDKTKTMEALNSIEPDVIVHTAADAHTKTCEEDPEHAKQLNIESTRYIAEYAKKNDAKVIQISTFACIDPKNVYGKTKLEAEEIATKLDNYVILRLSLVIGISPNRESHNFFNSLLDAIEEKKEMEVDSSWKFEPTCLSNLAEIVQKILEDPRIKDIVVPAVSEGVTSKYAIAKLLAEGTGAKITEVDQNRVLPVPQVDRSVYEKCELPTVNTQGCLDKIKG